MAKKKLMALVALVFCALNISAFASTEYGNVYLYSMYPTTIQVTVNHSTPIDIPGYSLGDIKQHTIGTTKLLQNNTLHVRYISQDSPTLHKTTKSLPDFNSSHSIYILITSSGKINISRSL